ncbi:MAG TPA: plastocyanin/azurin family copper-binding protein, partial [Thermodesulfobacteriota bacterium]|nr:plastocyanin/azurin family copper-binding protein [Thermodesulfobacteriota bacterium]
RIQRSRYHMHIIAIMILLFNVVSLSIMSGCDSNNSKRGESEPNNDFENCNLVSPNITINAVIDPSGDSDYFCFDVEEAGTVITAEVSNFSLLTPFIEFYGPGPGHELLDAGSTSVEDTVGAPLGRHFIVVGDDNGNGGPDYTYTLRITSTEPTPPPTASPTATPTSSPTAPPTATPTPAPSATPTPAPVIHDVSIIDNEFSPKDITINVGDTVRWTNNGALNHDVRSDDGTTFGSAGQFPLPTGMEPGDVFEFTFTSEGDFPYYCIFHGGPGGIGMSGSITVNP